MSDKIKRSQVQLTNEKIIAYCKKENSFQQSVYMRKIEAGTMSRMQAATNFCIIEQLKELAQDCEERNITWWELRQGVKELPARRRGMQGNLFEGKED